MCVLAALLFSSVMVATHATPVEEAVDYPVLLFSYFREGPRCGAEAIHLAYSHDGGNFTALNNNTPVLRGPDGFTSIRDPFIARDPNDVDTFHVVGTTGTFAKGITHIHYWNLTLASGEPVFSPHVMLDVMGTVDGAEECWAPEWTWDDDGKLYTIFFASGTPLNPAGGVATKSIWAVSIPSFATLTNTTVFQPFPLLQPNFSVIDANIMNIGSGKAQMFFKDESYNNQQAESGPGKTVKSVTASSADGPYVQSDYTLPVTQVCTEGPELVYFPSNGFGVGKYLLYYDTYESTCYGVSTVKDCAIEGGGCAPDNTTILPVSPDITAACGRNITMQSPLVNFPNMARHGSFTPITEKELAVLVKAYPTTELQDCHSEPENATYATMCIPYA